MEQDHGHTKPIVLNVPNIGPTRIYLWTTTPDASVRGRPAGEHKAQIILPGSPRGSRQLLDTREIPTALLGYSPLFGVFTAWQAELHADSGYSKNMQFREETLERGRALGWAVGEIRTTQMGPEVRMAVHPLHLARYLEAMCDADSRHLRGDERRAFLLLRAPTPQTLAAPPAQEPEGERERERIVTARLQRSSGFGRMVLAEYSGACAVCSLQLSIVEGAHIIPVHDPRSRDERWNGVCLCPNHHALYDSRIMRIDGSATVRVEQEDIGVLRQLNLLHGYDEEVRPFIDRPIHVPSFAQSDLALRDRWLAAFQTVFIG